MRGQAPRMVPGTNSWRRFLVEMQWTALAVLGEQPDDLVHEYYVDWRYEQELNSIP